jgi:AcrR family transcriptional regulator
MENTTGRRHQQKRSQHSRNNIVEAAYTLICSHGFAQTTSHDIAKEAGVSVGTFYAYFRNKEELLHEVAIRYNEQFSTEQTKVWLALKSNKTTFPQFIKTLIEGQVALHTKTKAFNRELKVLYYTDPVIAEISDNQQKYIEETITTYLQNTFSGAPKEISSRSFLITKMITAVIDEIAYGNGERDAESLIQTTIALLSTKTSTNTEISQ